ncbi:hypothetical protein BHE74_00020073 [Ensete ventricosum]|nr:hypothetical protein BHE74_00020073 [Ensete ventricosum]
MDATPKKSAPIVRVFIGATRSAMDISHVIAIAWKAIGTKGESNREQFKRDDRVLIACSGEYPALGRRG